MPPPLAIGLPVRNGGQHLDRAIKSILEQTFSDFTLVVSVNLSDDSTREIVAQHRKNDSRISVEHQHKLLKADENFDYVFRSTRSDFFVWAAHDDCWKSNHLSSAMNVLNDAEMETDFFCSNWWTGNIETNQGIGRDQSLFVDYARLTPRERVVDFINLHHLSHKCNIVYSVMRRSLTQLCLERTSIANDGLFGALMLYNGRPFFGEDVTFFKNWYGYTQDVSSGTRLKAALRHLASAKSFRNAKSLGRSDLIREFPQIRLEIDFIFESYKKNKYGTNYKISNLLPS